MISQIGYLGSVITPTVQQTRLLQETLDKFCLGPLNIAKKKRYVPVTEGGLGLIEISDYITALQCAWVKRVTQHWGDMWRYDLKNKCYGNPLIADSGTFEYATNPILNNICSSFGKFRDAFVKKDNNYKKAYIFKNPLFKRGRNDNRILCERFFGFGANSERIQKIARLKYEDFFNRAGSKTLEEVNQQYDLDFTLVDYMRIHESLEFSVRKIRDDMANADPVPPQSLDFFIKSFEKGSKPFRRFLQHGELKKLKINRLNTVLTFVEITGTNKPADTILRSCWGEWSKMFYSNRCREFLFKFRNNILGINTRVSKFVPGINAECSICIASREPLPIHSETFEHVFFNCAHSGKYRAKIEQSLFPELGLATDLEKKSFWFYGLLPTMQKSNMFISCIVNITNNLIWEIKLRKTVIPVSIFYEDLKMQVSRTLKMSSKLREAKNAEPFFACRHTYDPP
jgi:hypothetical protein